LSGHPQLYAYLALIAVCFFWGTTYLGIRMALESFPPMTLVATRFTLSGSLLLAAALLRGARLPRGSELWRTAFNGVVILGVGNGCLTMAETWIPSGMAALIITVSPFWMVGLDAAMAGGERLHGPTLAGMAVGLAGAALLVGPSALAGDVGGENMIKGFLILQAGCFCWNWGSLRQRRQRGSVHPVVSGGVQQLAAGLAFILPALIAPGQISWHARGAGALLYLVIFGSIVGYSAYIFALDRLPVAIVSLYNYINPVVAVALGWLFYREPFGLREALAMTVIFTGVAVVKRFSVRSGNP
jgi:drug/metabolite transporter (DMT)-like permease